MTEKIKGSKIFKKFNIVYLILILIALLGVGYGIYSYKFSTKRTITVSGTSKGDYANQISTYYITLEYHNIEKDKAVEELNQKSKEAVDKIKEFGIDPKDIKTQSLNIYQREEPYMEGALTKYKPEDWYASYSIEITLRDLERSEDLTAFLSTLESSNIWGPNLSIDSSKTDADELLISAIEDARDKAERMAKSMGGRVGKVLKVDEGSMSAGYFDVMLSTKAMGGGGAEGAPIEPGSTEISKSVTVTFELK